MTTILLATVLAAGPMSAAINQAAPATQPAMSVEDWTAQVVANTTIELPTPKAIETDEYQRTAPSNYRVPKEHWTKSVPQWCPVKPEWRHGYSCNMHQLVEDLFGHLQTAHGVSLETCNEIGRQNLQSYHEDLHWCEEPEARQQQFLNPQPAKQVIKSGCASGQCPSCTYSTRSRGFF